MDLFDDTPGDNTPEFSVSEIAGTVKKLIESELGWVRVKGEVGRVVLARSGHMYFDLKDDKSVLACMTWKGQVAGLAMTPEEGMEVIVEGKMTASGFQSKFGLNAQRIAIAGEGALMAMLEKRKKKLAAEGLFDDSEKQPLPYLPEIIGVVTSLQGAVIRDILHRLRDRFPRKVLIWPVAVQGEACAPEVTRAIDGFNALTPGGALPRPDLIIVARGGGSIEDLWGFNEESVARAAAASDIPLISAVGHETDTTLIDFVSDKRAPTPTAAAEMAVPVRMELIAGLGNLEARLARAVTRGIEDRRQKYAGLVRVLPRPESLLADPSQRLDRAAERIPRALGLMAAQKRSDLLKTAAGLRPGVLRTRIERENERIIDRAGRMSTGLTRAVERKRERLRTTAARLRPARLVDETRRQAEALQRVSPRLKAVFSARLKSMADRLAALERTRMTLGYQATLARGYAVVRGNDALITNVGAARKADTLEIEFADGRLKVDGQKKP
ncbi:exodeoxyribonuclease VII large subunit [Rhodobacteraceae bacterium]|nr:exodeoxyribonuclease VII large subunit [Paracoccaceae bacterium]